MPRFCAVVNCGIAIALEIKHNFRNFLLFTTITEELILWLKKEKKNGKSASFWKILHPCTTLAKFRDVWIFRVC